MSELVERLEAHAKIYGERTSYGELLREAAAALSRAEAADVPCTGEVFTTNPPRCVYWVALKHQLDCAEAHRDALAKALQEIDDLPVRELANGVDSVMRPVTYMAYSAYDVQRIVRSALRTLAAAADIQEKP